MADTPAPWNASSFPADQELATFAGGCFWSVQLMFDRLPGVVASAVGYAQGHLDNPTYKQVCNGQTGHTEAIQILYKPSEISFEQLVDAFFEKIDPLQRNGQGGDHGDNYRTGIYYHDQQQAAIAKAKVASIPNCAVEVEAFNVFWPAEEYHQRYLEKGGVCFRAQSAAKGCKDAIRCYG